MQELSFLRDRVATWGGLARRVTDLADLLELAIAEGDTSVEASARADLEAAEKELEGLEFQVQLSGPYDSRSAFLAVHAGAGGTDSQDWADMLLRMYLRWAERHGYSTEVLDVTEGEEAGIKSATIEITGPYAFGYLQSERGVHRLVRQSPFNAGAARQTSFAKVEVMPETEGVGEIEISPDDIRIDVYRSSGAGGQNVQKNSTAVRITHIPTGIVVTSSEKSQHQNRARAMKVLQVRLYEMQREALDSARADARKSQVGSGDRSERIRTYNFPQGRVTDHRINLTLYNLPKVLEGEALDDVIDPLIAEDQAARLAALEDELGG